MTQSTEDLEARLAGIEARLAALEAKSQPSEICIYAGQEYGEGAVLKQGDDQFRTCTKDFTSGRFQWK